VPRCRIESRALVLRLAVWLPLLTLGLAAPAGAAVTISPMDGTPAANPATQISVLGVAPKRIASVRAAGLRSGAHSGRLHAYSGARGASFVPAKPFAQGERVRVTVRLRGRAKALSSSFTIARLGPIPPLLTITATRPDQLEQFATRPDLQAPKISVLQGGSSTADPIFLTPLPSPIVHPESDNSITINPVGPGGPMIVDGQGKLVWFRKLTPPTVAANLAPDRYRGKPVLTWWQGPVTAQAFGLGKAIIADTSYRTIATVQAGNGYKMDLHELRLTPAGDAVFTVYSPVLVHLPGTPAGKLTGVLDSIIQQVDVKTGLVVWEWDALGHIPLSESYANPENSAAYDAFHINSVQPLAGGRLLVSARDAAAIYEVDQATGKIRWRLGGKNSSFKMGPGARFWLQHDARELPGDRVSLFDDEAGPPQKAPAARGLILQLDHRKHTAKVVRSVTRVPDTSPQSEGSTQLLSGGNVFVGFGSMGSFTEFSPSGKIVFDATLPDGDGSYRTLRFPWTGTPVAPPDVVARRVDASRVDVSVSWNGATRVARWEVLAAGTSTPIASAPRAGFETTIAVASAATSFTVRALSASGAVLGTSKAIAAP
jgi:hypothetical protein